jgi:hypothetical protein
MEIKLFLGVYLAYKLAGQRRSATEPSGIGILDPPSQLQSKIRYFHCKIKTRKREFSTAFLNSSGVHDAEFSGNKSTENRGFYSF